MITRLLQIIWSAIARVLARPAVASWLIRCAMRTPYSHIVKNGELYMERFWLFNAYPDTGESGADKRWWQFPISVRVHHIVLPDQDRHLHDHPWNARTIILRGFYREAKPRRPLPSGAGLSPEYFVYRRAGETSRLNFGEFHRITELSTSGAWTLFITGRHRGTWGFDVGGDKVGWREYLGITQKASSTKEGGPSLKTDHSLRRTVLLDIAVIYGVFIGLMIWNWW
jgi:hypothetical protein